MAADLVDDIDLALLRLLSEDGRATFAHLAASVRLSVAAAKRRVDRLRSLGVITGFTVQIDHSKLGWQVEAFTEIRYAGTMSPDEMIKSATQIPEVHAVSTIAGDPDAIIQLRARNHAHLQAIINRLRQGGGMVGTKTLIVLGSWRRNA